ncbi:HAD-IA family hydrolase [Larsenimonas suaedae]|uniref:HAD-IA family hydrolase n=1 Tax=Larsenimonas suaedae TaxID=1851019 RepID=A0ABU1GUV7_9GAMM|nr:HAD-IA family hydrolase [Larsenimonas suaedae]MCM2971114.1 HAD-IA family hydrolase [Larsenimonas suaedae]MDR5895823.1 HAD-IA family hydrolase [Larsenimonas suaedae]
MTYDLIIFDWDGTLMDSAARIVASMQHAGQDASVPVPSGEAVRRIIGLGLPEAIQTLWPEQDSTTRERIQARYSHHFVHAETHEAPLSFFEGVPEGIARLRAHGALKLAVATGKSRKGLDRVFRDHQCGDWFEASRTADMTASKPDPRMLEELLSELGCSPDRALMVGDTTFDLEMAERLGMDRVAMTYGVHDRDELLRHTPVFETCDFLALVRWVLES